MKRGTRIKVRIENRVYTARVVAHRGRGAIQFRSVKVNKFDARVAGYVNAATYGADWARETDRPTCEALEAVAMLVPR